MHGGRVKKKGKGNSKEILIGEENEIQTGMEKNLEKVEKEKVVKKRHRKKIVKKKSSKKFFKPKHQSPEPRRFT